MVGDRRRHRLHHVLDVVEARLDDRVAQRLEAAHVERDVVVHDEHRAGPVLARVADVGDHPLEPAAVEVAAAHRDDRAEAAVERAAARGLDRVDGLPEQGVAAEHAGRPIRQPQRVVLQRPDRPGRVVAEAAVGPERQPLDAAERPPRLERAQKLRERLLALAPHDEVDARRLAGPGVRREARVVAPHDDASGRPQAAKPLDEPERRPPLERHHRQADDVRLVLADEAGDRLADPSLREHQVGDRDPVVRVHVAGQRRQRGVRDADRDGRGVLERVRHREEQDVHGAPQGPVRPPVPQTGGYRKRSILKTGFRISRRVSGRRRARAAAGAAARVPHEGARGPVPSARGRGGSRASGPTSRHRRSG